MYSRLSGILYLCRCFHSGRRKGREFWWAAATCAAHPIAWYAERKVPLMRFQPCGHCCCCAYCCGKMRRCVQCSVRIASRIEGRSAHADQSDAFMSNELRAITAELNALQDRLTCVICQVIKTNGFSPHLRSCVCIIFRTSDAPLYSIAGTTLAKTAQKS